MALSRARRAELVSIWKPCLHNLRGGWYSTASVRDTLLDRAFRSNEHRYVGAPIRLRTMGFSRQTDGYSNTFWSLEDVELLAHYYRRQGYKAIATAIREAWLQILLEDEAGL